MRSAGAMGAMAAASRSVQPSRGRAVALLRGALPREIDEAEERPGSRVRRSRWTLQGGERTRYLGASLHLHARLRAGVRREEIEARGLRRRPRAPCPSDRPNFILRGARLATIDRQPAYKLRRVVGRLDAGEDRARLAADVERELEQLVGALDVFGVRRSSRCAGRPWRSRRSRWLSPPSAWRCSWASRGAGREWGIAAAGFSAFAPTRAWICFGSMRVMRC